MADIQDTLNSQIPSHIVESYPNFVEFLQAYYEWLNMDGNAYRHLKNHMDYLTFEKSMDDYVDFMQREYLYKIPQNVFSDKELFIEWSRTFNLARGSHDSYKFLFRVLFGEQDTEIYLPKENILKTSDGDWVSDRSTIIANNPGNPEDLLFRQLTQTRELFTGITESATVVVESYRTIYINGFNVVELTVSSVKGVIKEDYPLISGDIVCWPVKTISEFEIESAGSGYSINEWLTVDNVDHTYVFEDFVREEGTIDTRISTILDKNRIRVYRAGVQLNSEDFFYDGQFITGETITKGITIRVEFDSVYSGIVYIKEVDDNGSVTKLGVLEPAIGVQTDTLDLSYDPTEINSSGMGSGLVAKAVTGLTRRLDGYYVGEKGQLSSSMVLQDSDFYQDYSYVIKTSQDISDYGDYVKDILHPAGFKMFGNLQLLYPIEVLIGVEQLDIGPIKKPRDVLSVALSVVGSNYTWIAKAADNARPYLSTRVYDGREWDQVYIDGTPNYSLEDDGQQRIYDITGQDIDIVAKGWMASQPLMDADVRQPNSYFEHDAYEGLYQESSFVLNKDSNDSAFVNKYIEIYNTFDYSEEGYSE